MTARQKTGGRKTGTPNKVTRELRELLKNVLYKEFENLPDLLEGLSAKERVEVIVRLAPFVLPKINPVGMGAGEDFGESWNLG